MEPVKSKSSATVDAFSTLYGISRDDLRIRVKAQLNSIQKERKQYLDSIGKLEAKIREGEKLEEYLKGQLERA